MATTHFRLLALCLAAAALPAIAQTSPPPPDAGAAKQTAGSAQNPSVNGYKDSKPSGDAAQRPSTGGSKEVAGAAKDSNPTSTDSMGKDNRPRHPAADGKTSDPK